MTRLFSRFDLIIFSSSYLILPIPLILLLSSTHKITVLNSFYTEILERKLANFFYTLKPNSFNKARSLIISSIIIVVFFLNFFSVYSFVFPVTSQFGSMLSYALIFWGRFILVTLIKNSKGFFSHFVPEGTPMPLIPFLFLIEIVRNLIRPLTLTVRLVANILAGHLLMILLSSLVFKLNLMFLSYIILNLIELAVSIIQAYIFSTIISLYYSEVH